MTQFKIGDKVTRRGYTDPKSGRNVPALTGLTVNSVGIRAVAATTSDGWERHVFPPNFFVSEGD